MKDHIFPQPEIASTKIWLVFLAILSHCIFLVSIDDIEESHHILEIQESNLFANDLLLILQLMPLEFLSINSYYLNIAASSPVYMDIKLLKCIRMSKIKMKLSRCFFIAIPSNSKSVNLEVY